METTNTEEFCLSCHTMNDNMLPELMQTVHWSNRSGVRATCSSCHVPHDFSDKIARKMQASREVLSHLMGDIGTREKFLEHRIVLAQREWARFDANNSKECRNCHDYAHMDFDKMRVTSQTIMRSAAERNASCVSCHKGIAHQLPEMKGVSNPAFATLTAEAKSTNPDEGKVYYSAAPQPLYADEGLSQELGSMEVATPVKVLETKGDAVKVELDLWRKDKGHGRILYNNFGFNITEAILNADFSRDENIVKPLESKEDPLTGLNWDKVAVVGWVKEGALLEKQETIWDIAKHSYDTSCSTCHRQPAATSHTANQWPALFSGMVGFTSMDDETAGLVLKYLQLHSSDFANTTHGAGSPENTLQTARP